jgi:hypothetical protein
MLEKNVSQEVLEKIKGSQPKSKWQFVIKDYCIWTLGFISLILSSLGFASTLYMLLHNDWDVYRQVSGGLFSFIFLTLPYFWLIFLAVFIYTAEYIIRHTKRGYKFEFSRMVIASISISIIFGSFFYNVGIGEAIDDAFARRLPFYGKLVNPRQQIWLKIDDGLLGGVILEKDGKTFILKDMQGREWQVFAENAIMLIDPQVGQPIRSLGEKIDEGRFEADMILPMRGMHWMKGHPMFERKVKGVRIIR